MSAGAAPEIRMEVRARRTAPPPEKKMNLPRRGLDKNKIFVIIYNEGYIDIV